MIEKDNVLLSSTTHSKEDRLLLGEKKKILDLADAYQLDSASNLLESIPYDSLINPLSIGVYYYINGYILDYQENYKESIRAYQKAIEIFEENKLNESLELGLAYNDLAYVYTEVSLEAQALKYYKKAYDIIWNYHKDKPDEVASVANNYLGALVGYGSAYDISRIRSETESYFEKISPERMTDGESLDMYSIYYLGCVKSFSKDFEENSLDTYLRKVDQLFNEATEKNREAYKLRWIYTYDYAGYAYLENKRFDKALTCFGRMDKLAENKRDKMKSASNFAAYYLQTNNYKQAEKAYEKSLQLIDPNQKDINYLMLQAARIWMIAKQGNRQLEAKQSIQELWREILPEKTDLQTTNLDDLDEANSTRWMFIINTTAEVYRKYYQSNPTQEQDFTVALNMATLSAKMFQNYYLKESFNDNLSEHLNANREDFLELITHLPEYQVAEKLNLIENNTSQHLWKNFLIKNSQKTTVHPKLLEQQNQLLIEAINDETAKLKLQVIDEKITQQVSRYAENRFQAIDITSIQKKIKPHEAILRFLPTTEWLFAVAISKNRIQIKKIGSISNVDSLTQVHYKYLTTIDKKFTVSAKDLYRQFVQPFDFENIQKLTVIPEGSLLNIPFESLMNEKGKPLGIEKVITYAPSLYFLNAMDKKGFSVGENLVAFAPEYTTASQTLENTSLEVEAVKKSMGGKVFDKAKATKQAFLDNILEYQVQHLAMHATMDTADYENSSLLFTNNERLSFSEIYQLTIPAEMVTLSACNTGVGTLVNGEGLMSLSRALLYAGTSSVVHSLWRVPDQETAEIMGYFYQNLSSGMPKDLALQEAKKAFVEHNPLKQHPYFWTGFVLTGDTSPLETSSGYWWLIVGVLALAFSYIFVRRRLAFSRQKF